MIVFEFLFWLLLILVSYGTLIYILFKGRQYNRFFATFINTIVPIIGSVPTFIIACKYERQIGGRINKISETKIKYILIGLQLLSVLLMFLPVFSVSSGSISGINLIFGKAVEGEVLRPTMILAYMLVLPVIAAVLNFFYNENNISNFITYSVSLVNILSLQILNFVISSNGAKPTLFFWLYSILGVAIMFVSIVRMIMLRDSFLRKLEAKENDEELSNQKKKNNDNLISQNQSRTYKCAKCGNMVPKGTICSCIERRMRASTANLSDANDLGKAPDSYCVYCKKPLSEGESCNCQGEGFGITIKNEASKDRKCIYCGQPLVGESTCVCEKIMKNSAPIETENGTKGEPKRYFESQVEKSSNIVADELAQLEKKINSRFEQVIENMDLTTSGKE